MSKPAVNYRDFRWCKRNSEEYRHLKLVLFWPAYFLAFWFVEQFFHPAVYHEMRCRLDDWIPFCEFFVIPYVFWYTSLFWMSLYTLLYDVDTFRRFTKFIAVTFSLSILTYIVWPTCQNLRPEPLPRDNALTHLLGLLYAIDPSRNVCPSMHVIGAAGVLFASGRLERFRTPGWRAFFWALTAIISVSTVFLKQHSAVDVVAAAPYIALGYALFFRRKGA